jgi:hypothetical protein
MRLISCVVDCLGCCNAPCLGEMPGAMAQARTPSHGLSGRRGACRPRRGTAVNPIVPSPACTARGGGIRAGAAALTPTGPVPLPSGPVHGVQGGDGEMRTSRAIPPRLQEGIRHRSGRKDGRRPRSVAHPRHRWGAGNTPASMGADRGVGGRNDRASGWSFHAGRCRLRTKTRPLIWRDSETRACRRREVSRPAATTSLASSGPHHRRE